MNLRPFLAALLCLPALLAFPARAQTPVTLSEPVRVSGPDFDFPHFEPHLAVNPHDPGNMIAASMAVPEAGGGHTVRLYTTFDGGASWAHVPLDTTEVYGGDPWLAFGPDGTAFFTYLPGWVQRSTDGGRTWSPPVKVPEGPAEKRGGGAFDYPKLLVDRTGGKYHGRLYISSSQGDYLDSSEGPVWPVAINRSLDRGQSFSFPVHILPGNINFQPGKPAILSDGTLVVTYSEITHDGNFLDSPRHWITRSEDGGVTFQTPRLLEENFIAMAPHLAADTLSDRFRDRLYAVWPTGPTHGNHFLASWSSDRGTTWTDPIRVNDGPAHVPGHSPATAVNRDGVLGTMWMDSRSDTSGTCKTPFFAVSADGGQNFTPNLALKDGPSCNNTPANRVAFSDSGMTVYDRWGSGGDYFGLVALPDGDFQALWADSRTGVLQLWTRRIELQK